MIHALHTQVGLLIQKLICVFRKTDDRWEIQFLERMPLQRKILRVRQIIIKILSLTSSLHISCQQITLLDPNVKCRGVQTFRFKAIVFFSKNMAKVNSSSITKVGNEIEQLVHSCSLEMS